ncbi:hypothetical protein GCM10009849_11410 [Sinomonas flava]|uniref:Large ribosomal subunit protein bL36 n=1 Tax=Sinomonas flava TaxID=496857 RepID=A0ABP5NK38_9MICC
MVPLHTRAPAGTRARNMRTVLNVDGCEAHEPHRPTKGTTMKVRNSLHALKKIPGAQVVRRRGRTFVINKKNPRVKARQG